MLYPRVIRLSPKKGGFKEASWQTTQPTAHTSTLKLYFSRLIISGARQRGVPTLVACNYSIRFNITATPKSPSFTRPFLVRNTFIVFMSLCIILFLCRYSAAFDSPIAYYHISYSEKCFLFFFYNLIFLCKSPPSAYSITIYSPFLSLKEAQYQIMLGCLIFSRTRTSLWASDFLDFKCRVSICLIQ